jgi:hypothetical protein
MIDRDREDGATRAVPRRERVLRCPYVQTNVRWPVPVDQRLNELLALLNAAGIDTTRSQLLAALVAMAPTELVDLQQLLQDYTEKSAGAVVLQSRGPIEVPARRPGRRART